MIALAIALAAPAVADAPAASPSPQNASRATEHTISGALIINPAGLYVRYDLRVPLAYGFSIGLLNNWQVYGNGVGVQLRWQTEPAWFETHLDLSTEPGFYLQRPPGARIGAELDPGAEDGDRTFGWRHNATWQTNINIRSDAWWLYSRTTALYRLRDFVEADTFGRMQIGDEASLEQATAIMRSVARWGEAARLWAYLEYTVGGVLDVGNRPNRPSAGFIVEGWPYDGASLNLDAFYSVAPGSLAGAGLITAWWFRW